MRPHDFHLKAMATGDIDLILCFNDYNLVRQNAADDILPYAAEHDIGVMNGWSILRGISQVSILTLRSQEDVGKKRVMLQQHTQFGNGALQKA